jgi:cobalamin-dependent methionine synthase I
MLDKAPVTFEPKGVYRIFEIDARTEGDIHLEQTDFTIKSKQVARMLSEAEKAVLFMVTIGDTLEKEVKRLFDEDHMAEAVILDAIGSETADAAADILHKNILRAHAREAGYDVTPRFSPGYGDWPVTVQSAFLKACGGKSIGISVNPSSLMMPRKSVSAVVGYRKT